MQIVVLGYIVRGPLGGLVWHHLQYVLGLKKLGHQVLFIEDSDDFPGCYNPHTNEVNTDPSYGLNFINEVFGAFNCHDNWAYFDAHSNNWFGRSKQNVLEYCKKADLVLNISGVNPVRSWWSNIPIKVFIDTDPGFTQIKNLTEESAKEASFQHTHFFSFGENIGRPDCFIPDDGHEWKATRQPVFLNAWKVAPYVFNAKWTTVMQWDSYKSREFNNTIFGMKSMAFTLYDQLPMHLKDEKFELALGSSSAPSEQLQKLGWQVINPLVPTKTAWNYREYIANSKGEWTVAKHGYVKSNSGWFSERTLCYMASSKPVVVQDTGFSNNIETGKGILPFNSLQEAVENIKKVNAEYKVHCLAARKSVIENFNSDAVLKNLLEQL